MRNLKASIKQVSDSIYMSYSVCTSREAIGHILCARCTDHSVLTFRPAYMYSLKSSYVGSEWCPRQSQGFFETPPAGL